MSLFIMHSMSGDSSVPAEAKGAETAAAYDARVEYFKATRLDEIKTSVVDRKTGKHVPKTLYLLHEFSASELDRERGRVQEKVAAYRRLSAEHKQLLSQRDKLSHGGARDHLERLRAECDAKLAAFQEVGRNLVEMYRAFDQLATEYLQYHTPSPREMHKACKQFYSDPVVTEIGALGLCIHPTNGRVMAPVHVWRERVNATQQPPLPVFQGDYDGSDVSAYGCLAYMNSAERAAREGKFKAWPHLRTWRDYTLFSKDGVMATKTIDFEGMSRRASFKHMRSFSQATATGLRKMAAKAESQSSGGGSGGGGSGEREASAEGEAATEATITPVSTGIHATSTTFRAMRDASSSRGALACEMEMGRVGRGDAAALLASFQCQ